MPLARPTALAVTLLVALAGPLRAQPRGLAGPSSDRAAARAVDSLLALYARPGLPGAAVLVVRRGCVLLARGYGLADVEAGRPVTSHTAFRLASLTKAFTATAIMRLAAAGALRYDDAVSAYVPGLPAYAAPVTVRQLLTHTSGLPDYEDFVPDRPDDPPTVPPRDQVHDADVPRLIAGAPGLRFAPGARYAYSNTGYVLLALVAERAGGARFGEVLRRQIFAPLGMAAVAYDAGGPPVPHRAYGYTVPSAGDGRGPPAAVRTDQSRTSATLGDGGVYASIADLARWDRALERHALVSPAPQRLAWTPPTLADGTPGPYGFGWFVDREGGALRLRHHGESRGFTHAILRYPDARLTVVVLTNRTGGAPWTLEPTPSGAADAAAGADTGAPPWALAARIAALYQDRPAVSPPGAPAPPSPPLP